MVAALDRWAAPLLLGAAGALAGVSALFSAGSSGGRLTWIGLAAICLAAAAGAAALFGLPRPALSREALVALGSLLALVAWSGISVVWSIEPDRSWARIWTAQFLLLPRAATAKQTPWSSPRPGRRASPSTPSTAPTFAISIRLRS